MSVSEEVCKVLAITATNLWVMLHRVRSLHVLVCRYCLRFKQHLTRSRSLGRQFVEDTQEWSDSHALSPEARQRIKKRLCCE